MSLSHVIQIAGAIELIALVAVLAAALPGHRAPRLHLEPRPRPASAAAREAA